MKILIDGCIFVEQHAANSVAFWTTAVPILAVELDVHCLYYLNREFGRRFPDRHNLKILCAPRVDWAQSALEDRRLAALCRELEIDVFVSTYNTSAGAQVRSLFVSTDEALSPQLSGNHTVDPVVLSARRAANMACRRWIIPSLDLENMPQLVEQLLQALRNAAEGDLSNDDNARRAMEEESVVAQAGLLRQIAQEETLARHHAHQKQLADQARSAANPVRRVYQALRQPSRYREYATRILMRIKGNRDTTTNR